MSYKNTMKIFSSNFSLVWKHVLYFSLCILFFAICTYYSAKPLIELFEENMVGVEFNALFDGFYSRGNITTDIFDVLSHIFDVLLTNFGSVYMYVILFLLFAFLLPYIFFQIANYNLCSIMYKKLSMNMTVGYFQNLVGTLKNSIIYALTNVVLSIPFWSINIVLVEIYIGFFDNIIMRYLGLVALSGLLILLGSVKNALTAVYVGNAVETENLAPIAFGNSLPISLKNFASILSTCILMKLTIVVSNGFVGIFTFFAGLILSIPATAVLQSVGFTVLYCNKTGQRYYLGNSFIFNPVKYAIKQDEMRSPIVIEEKVDEQIETTIMNSRKNKKR